MNATVWTIFGVFGTAIAGAVVTKLVALVFEWSARLMVHVSVHKAFKVPSMITAISELRLKLAKLQEGFKLPDDWIFNTYYQLFNSETYLRYEIKNNSNKKLGQLTVCVHSGSSSLLQVGDGELREIKADEPYSLGDLQPRRELTIHILLGSLPGVYTVQQIKERVTFSADELGRIAYKFPWPMYLKHRFQNWIGNILFLLAILGVLTGIVLKIYS